MKTPPHIMYKGRMYRLAADEAPAPAPAAAPEAILETGGNPLETPVETPADTEAAAKASDDDKAKLTAYKDDVSANATALVEGLDAFMNSLSDREKSDEALDTVKKKLDALIETFKILSIAYTGYAKRNQTGK